jgi:hypothetical protein
VAILRIYQDSRAPGQCRSCGAPIQWAELVSSKRHPFDRLVISGVQADLLGGRIIEEIESAHSHFVTCPDAKTWARR